MKTIINNYTIDTTQLEILLNVIPEETTETLSIFYEENTKALEENTSAVLGVLVSIGFILAMIAGFIKTVSVPPPPKAVSFHIPADCLTTPPDKSPYCTPHHVPA